jgi:hypothetical protein
MGSVSGAACVGTTGASCVGTTGASCSSIKYYKRLTKIFLKDPLLFLRPITAIFFANFT